MKTKNNIKIITIYLVLFLVSNFVGTYSKAQNTKIRFTDKGVYIETMYGNTFVEEPIIKDLIQHKAMQRLKKIHQYGVSHYAMPQELYGQHLEYKDFTRFDHSVGVFFILRQYGASREEQITGLLHDVSHTVFSHVGDFLYADYETDGPAYQDTIFNSFLINSGLSTVIKKHRINVEAIDPERQNYTILEQNLPDVCADRLEYTLHGGLLNGTLTQKDITQILLDLHYGFGIWYFTSIDAARTFAKASFILTQKASGPAWNTIIFRLAAKALKRAVEIGLIEEKEILTLTDDTTWNKLKRSGDDKIIDLINRVENNQAVFEITNSPYETRSQCHEKIPTKFRVIDPIVMTINGLKRLTEVCANFKLEYDKYKEMLEQGWPVRYSPTNSDDE